MKKAAQLLKVDEAYAYVLLSFVPDYYKENGLTLSANITVNVEKINRIDYKVNGNVVRAGFLPAGAKVADFAPVVNNLLFWTDGNGNVVTKMPDYDVVLTPVFNDGKAYPTADINKVFDGESETVGVVIGDTANEYTYKWYKGDDLIDVTANSFEVKNVSDTGVYTYVVTGNGVTHTGSINVTITPKKLDASSVALKNDFFEYDGQIHEVELEIGRAHV